MIIDIILGNNIDTKIWIQELRGNGADEVIVVDYDSTEEYEEIDGTSYMTPNYAKNYIGKYDTKNYYKSMYIFPGMLSTMSSLRRSNNDRN
ncbi:MAG: hypothetical protein N2A99_00270 [Carnobacterium alterfunditum]